MRRLKDIVFHGQYNDYHFSSYIAYDSSNKNSWKIVSNKSFFTDLKRDQTLLFEDEGDVKYLLNDLHDVDYIVHSPDSFVDFSVILLPEMLFFPIQEFSLSSDTDLYQILQYYE